MSATTAWGLLTLRVVLGAILIMHGYLGYANFGPRGVATLVTRLGAPSAIASPLAWYFFIAHTVGGILIVVGLWTRTAAFLNVPILTAAVTLLHWPEGFAMKAVVVDPSVNKAAAIGYEFSLLVLANTVAITLIGAGPFSLDRARSAPVRRH
jgi:putative oxidoreductase